MTQLQLIAGLVATAIIGVLLMMLTIKDARIDALDAALTERNGVIVRQDRQAQQLAAAHKIEVIRGDNARAQVAAGDAAVKQANAKAADMTAALAAARKEIRNARDADAPAAPVLVRAFERMHDFAASYRALRSGDGVIPGDGAVADSAGAAGAAGPGLGAGLTQGGFADACLGTAEALSVVASNVVALRDRFVPQFNANVEVFNARAKSAALEGVSAK